MNIQDFQRLIEATYFRKDSRRGVPSTFMWLVEEVGELGRDLRDVVCEPAPGRDPAAGRMALESEFADVLAWLSTLASMAGVDLEAAAVGKYGGGCPRCRAVPCACDEARSERPPGAGAPGAGAA